MRTSLPLLFALLLAGCPGETPARPAGPRPRVITAAPALAEMVCALGAKENLVGVSRFCLHPPELEALPRIGGIIDPNLAEIDRLAPDLILWQGRSDELRELAARRGARLETFEIERLEQVRASLRRLGEILERREQAAAEVARIDSALAAAGTGRTRPPVRTLLVLGHQLGELSQVASAGPETFISECLVAAGGENALAGLPLAGGSWPYVAPEVLLRIAPELIVELHADPVDPARAAALRKDWQALPDLPAVKQRRIAIVVGSGVLVPGPRLTELVEKLARAVRGETDLGVSTGPTAPGHEPTWPR